MSRYKPKGWRNEPHRHALAAKGIKTRQFFAAKADDRSPMSLSKFLDEAKNGELRDEEEDESEYFSLVRQKQTSERDEYYASKSEDGMFSGMLTNREGEREKEMLKNQDIQKVRANVIQRLDKAVSQDELDPQKRQQFMEDVFARLRKDYEQGVYDYSQFKRKVEGQLDRYMNVHSKKLRIFDIGRDGRNRT